MLDLEEVRQWRNKLIDERDSQQGQTEREEEYIKKLNDAIGALNELLHPDIRSY